MSWQWIEQEFGEALAELKKWAGRELVWRPLDPFDGLTLHEYQEGIRSGEIKGEKLTAEDTRRLIGLWGPTGIGMVVLKGVTPAMWSKVGPAIGRVFKARQGGAHQLLGLRSTGPARQWWDVLIDGQPHIVKLTAGSSKGSSAIRISRELGTTTNTHGVPAILDDIVKEIGKTSPVEKLVVR